MKNEYYTINHFPQVIFTYFSSIKRHGNFFISCLKKMLRAWMVMIGIVFALYTTSMCHHLLCQLRVKKNVSLIVVHTKGQPDETEEK